MNKYISNKKSIIIQQIRIKFLFFFLLENMHIKLQIKIIQILLKLFH